MGLFIITGTMGGGKSYFGAEICRDAWKAGAIVHSNLDFVVSEVEARGFADRFIDLSGLEPQEWRDHMKAGEEGKENVVVIDEASLCFHVHDAQANRKQNRSVFEFIVWSRKLGLDVYFITQSAENIDAAIRRTAEMIIHCVNVKRIPWVGAFAADVFGTFKRYRLTPGKRSILGATYHRFDSDVGSLYDTHGFAGRTMGVERVVTKKESRSPLSRKLLWSAAIGLPSLAVLGAWSWFNGGPHIDKPNDQAPALAARPQAKEQPKPASLPEAPAATIPLYSTASGPGGLRIYGEGRRVYALGAQIDGRKITGIMRKGAGWVATFQDGGSDELQPITREQRQQRIEAWKQKQQSSFPLSAGHSLPAGS